jgi:hypothetical protein
MQDRRKHVFGDDEGGHLTVNFELADRRGGTLFSEPIATSLFGVPVADLTATDYGSGYPWFVSISEGLELPIDEYTVRRGN